MLHTNNKLGRITALTMALTMVLNPLVALADDAKRYAQEAKQLGQQQVQQFQMPSQDNTNLDLGSSGTIRVDELAPADTNSKQPDPDTLKDLYRGDGNINHEFRDTGRGSQDTLFEDAQNKGNPFDPNPANRNARGPQTLSGAAYQVVLGVKQARNEVPSLANDPLVHNSVSQGLANSQLLDSFGDCSTRTQITESYTGAHVPDLYTCGRVLKPEPGECTANQEIVIKRFMRQKTVSTDGYGVVFNSGSTSVKPGSQAYKSGGELTFDFKPALGPNAMVKYCGAEAPPQAPSVTVDRAGFSIGLPSLEATYDWIVQTEGGSTRTVKTTSYTPPNLAGASSPGLISGGTYISSSDFSQTIERNEPRYYGFSPGQIVQFPTCSNNLVAKVRAVEASTGRVGGGSFAFAGMGQATLTLNEYYYEAQSQWYPAECIESLDPEWCEIEPTVLEGAASGCLKLPTTDGGAVTVCPGDEIYSQLSDAPVEGMSRLVTQASIYSDCTQFNVGEMDCWTDINGEEQCYDNPGDIESTCGELEDNPQCGFVKTECLENGRGKGGFCYVYEDTYDCGANVQIAHPEVTEVYDCAGPVRCMGDDCIEIDEQPNSSGDFLQAAAMLEAAQAMSQDMECNPDGSGCKIFKGKAYECKRAVGGLVDCCKRPNTVSFKDYIDSLISSASYQASVISLQKKPTVVDGFQHIVTPALQTFTMVTQFYTGYISNVGKAAKDVMKHKISLRSGEAILKSTMTVYATKELAKTLASMVWKCGKGEAELGIKRELKSCTHIGSYCKKRTKRPFRVCIERRTSYCCFNAPLARILQEQIRPQIKKSWGSASSPSCGGIAVDVLERVDWDRINLNEWMGILQQTNNMPNAASMTLENITGSGSKYSFDEGRDNSLDRNIERFQGSDIDSVRDKVKETVPITTGAPGDR